MINSNNEKNLAYNVARFLHGIENKYNLVWRFDLAADMKLTTGQASAHKRLQMKKRGFTDLVIFEPKNGYSGLLIELKKSKDEVFKKNGEYKKQTKKVKNNRGVVIGEYDHIQEQLKMHDILRSKGYYVVFGFGLQDTIEKINLYLKG